MASSFLKKKAEEQAKKIDQQYGESAYGGSSTLRSGTPSSPSAQTQTSAPTFNGGGGGSSVRTRASDFLARKAREAAEGIDKEYGADAYGGSSWTALDKEGGFNSWLDQLNSFSSRVGEDYSSREGAYQNRDALGSYRDERDTDIEVMLGRADIYKDYFSENMSYYDELYGEGSTAEILRSIDEGRKYLGDVRTDLDSEYDYWSQWETEDDYNGYLEQVKEYERLSSYDVEGGKSNLEVLEAQRSELWTKKQAEQQKISAYSRAGNMPSQLKEAREAFASYDSQISALDDQITGLQQELQQAEDIQTANRYTAYMDEPDFSQYSKQGASMENPALQDVEKGVTIFGWSPFSEKPNNIVTYSRDNWESIAMGEANNSQMTGRSLYHWMTDDEVGIYNYILAKEGNDAAQKYLDSIEETLNYRFGTMQAENIQNVGGVGEALLTGLYGLGSGLDQFGSGVRQLFSSERLPTTATQFGSAKIREGLEDTGPEVFGSSLGQMGYDLLTTTGNMAPSILLSAFTAGLGAPTAAASAVGSATLGLSAGGNAYNQALADGYTKEQARSYSALVGLSEGGLQYLLGGIGSLSGTGGGKLAAKIAGIDSGIARLALNVGVSMAREGTEEGLQEVLEPVFRTLIFDEELDVSASDVAYAAMLGALSAGVLDGVAQVTSTGRGGSEALVTREFSSTTDGYIGESGVDYFEGINDIEELQTKYRELAKENHPDIGGTEQTMSDINRQYAMKKAFYTAQQAAESAPAAGTQEAPAASPSAESGFTGADSDTDLAVRLVRDGVDRGAADSIASSIQSIVRGEEISGNKAAEIAQNEAAVTLLSELTGIEINTDAPISEVKTAIRNLASRTRAANSTGGGTDTSGTNEAQERIRRGYASKGERTVAVQAFDTERIGEIADTLGKAGAKALTSMYDATTQDAESYFEGMTVYYNAGKNGAKLSSVKDGGTLTQAQKQAAYLAGQSDAQVSGKENVAASPASGYTGGITNTETEVIQNGREEGNQSGSRSGERTYGVAPAEPSTGVSGGTEKAQSGAETQRRRAESLRAAVQAQGLVSQSTAGQGISSGTNSKTLTVVPSSMWTQEMKSAAQEQRAAGRQVTYFTGEMELNGTDGTFRARGAISADGKRIWVRADHDTLTVEQISKHEEFHALVKKDPELMRRTRDGILSEHGEEELTDMVNAYIDLYGWTDVSLDYVMEELLADAYAGIDIFEDLSSYEGATRFTSSVRENVGTKENAPADDGESTERYSLSKTKAERLTQLIRSMSQHPVEKLAGDKKIRILTDDYTVDKALYSTKGRSSREVNARVAAVPDFHAILRDSSFWYTDTDIKPTNKAKKGVVAMHYFTGKYGEWYVEVVIRDKGSKQYLYEVKFHKNNPQQTMPSKNGLPAPEGDVEDYKDDYITTDGDVKTSQEVGALQERLYSAQEEYRSLDKKNKEYEKQPEYEQMLNDIGSLKGDALDEALAKYGKWEKSSGYADVYHRMEELRGELKTLSRKIEDAKELAAKSAKEEYRALYNDEFAKKYASKAARKFGTTSRFNLAGYLTVNGSLLDFSDRQGYRVQDHREVADVLDFLPDEHEYSDGLIEFMNMGNIRLQSYGIDIAKAPNKAQVPVLRRFFDSLNGEATVDFSNENGDSRGSVDYPEGTRSDRILRDINSYFETGNVPTVSMTQMFHFSQEPPKRIKNALAALDGMEVSVGSNTAKWTSERIDKLYDDYAASSPNYSKAYATFISPDDFLSLTTTNLQRIEAESSPLDIESLRNETQDIHLTYDPSSPGEVWGHEGRHRMVALRNAGIKKVAITVHFMGESGKSNRKPIDELPLIGEEWGDKRAAGKVTLKDLVPISRAYRDEIEARFGAKEGDFLYSQEPKKLTPLEMEARLDGLREERDDIVERLNDDIFDELSETERKRLENHLTKLYHDIDVLVAEEGNATVKTPLRTIKENLSKYRRSDLESLAEQISDGNWDGYEELSRFELEFALAEELDTLMSDMSVLEAQAPKFGLYVRPVPAEGYSRDPQSIKELREQNEELREKVSYWKWQTKRTERATLRQGDIDKLARTVIKSYESELEVSDINAELKALGEYIVNGEENGNELTFSEVKHRAVGIARDVIQNAYSLVNNEEADTYRDIKAYFRGTKLAFNDKSDIADYNDFRKRNFGRLTIARDGLPVDVAYQELTELYGEGYFPSDIINPADQLLHIADLLDGMRPIYENPHSYYMAEAIEYCANEIIDGLISEGVRQTPPTFADRQAAKLDKAKSETAAAKQATREAVAAGREAEKAAYLSGQMTQGAKMAKEMRTAKERSDKRLAAAKQAIEKERARRKEQLSGLKEHYRTKEAKAREGRRERALRAKIVKHVKELSAKLLKPSDKNHIPESLRSPVAALLNAINLESQYTIDPDTGARLRDGTGDPTKRTEAFNELRSQYRDIEDGRGDYSLVIDPDLMDNLDAVVGMKDTKIADMNAEQLYTIWQTIRAIEASIASANKMLGQSRYETISGIAEALRQDYEDFKTKQNRSGFIGGLDKFLSIEMLKPVDYMHRLGRAGDALWQELRNAQDSYVKRISQTEADMKAVIGDTDMRDWGGKKAKITTFTTEGGDSIDLTPAQVMELYLLTKRPQALQHILKGGIRQATVERKGGKLSEGTAPAHVTVNDLAKIIGTLTAEQTRIADELGKYASGVLSGWGNEASMAVYGYRKFTEDHYWPIRSDPSYTKSESGKGVDVTIKGRGFTKQTVQHANNAIMIGDALDTFAQHVNDMATYSSWLAAIEDAERLKNFRYRNDEGDTVGSVKETINRVLGSAGTKYLDLLIEDINQGVKTKNDSFNLSRFTANYKAAAVGANLRVIVQQPTAILRAAAVIDPKYLAAGALRKSNWERVKKWAPIAQWKDWGYFELDNGRLIKDIILGTDSAIDRVRQAAMTPAGKADSITWGKIWTACEAEILATRKELKEGTDEFYSAVAKRFNEVIDRSQVVDGILQRNQTMRSSSDLVRMATSFMSEPVTSFSMLSSALYETTHAKDERARTRARKRLARTLAAVLMADILCAAVASLIDALRDDDKEKDYWQKWAEAFTGITGDEESFTDYLNAILSGNLGSQVNLLAKIPFVEDIFSLLQGYSITRMDMDSVNKLLQSVQRMLKALNGQGKATVGAALADLLANASRLWGLPVYNVKRDLTGAVNTTLSAIGNWELMYEADKLLYSVDSSDNKGRYYDIAFYAWQEEDHTQYNAICADLISHGYTQKDIDNAIRTRLKKTEEFAGASGERAESITADLERSSGFKGLPADYQTKALEAANDYATATTMREQNEDYELPSTYSWVDKADAGASVGIETWEYILFRTALQMADDDGSLKQEEVIDALEGMSWLSDEERDYLFGTRYESDKNNPWA